jgi:hypothetical protein
MKEGVNNKMKGDANAWLKRGDTLVIQGDMQGAVVGYTIPTVCTCYGTDLTYTIAHCSMLFPTVSWPMTSALAANLTYLYMLPLCTFFSSLYYNVVI